MKKTLLLIFAAALMASCVKQSPIEEPADPTNGYGKILKLIDDEVEYPIIAGQNLCCGYVRFIWTANDLTVLYNLRRAPDETKYPVYYTNPLPYVGGYTMTESHLWVGEIGLMPITGRELNGNNNPKVGRFNYQTVHPDTTTVFYYTIPMDSLPDINNGGFTTAAHCVVGLNNQEETAWARFLKPFKNDKDWGWYDDITYTDPTTSQPTNYVYAISVNGNVVETSMLDISRGNTVIIWQEEVTAGTTVDGIAHDDVNSILYYTVIDNGVSTLKASDLTSATDPVVVGIIPGTAAGGTYYDGEYWYVDQVTGNIISVTVTDNVLGTPNTEGTVPGGIIINDVAMNDAGTTLYIIGVDTSNGNIVVYQFDTVNHTIDNGTPISGLNDTAQITWDGTQLIAIQELAGGGWEVRTINLEGGTSGSGGGDTGDPGGGKGDVGGMVTIF